MFSIRACTETNIYTIYVCVYMCKHTHTHTHTHTYTLVYCYLCSFQHILVLDIRKIIHNTCTSALSNFITITRTHTHTHTQLELYVSSVCFLYFWNFVYWLSPKWTTYVHSVEYSINRGFGVCVCVCIYIYIYI